MQALASWPSHRSSRYGWHHDSLARHPEGCRATANPTCYLHPGTWPGEGNEVNYVTANLHVKFTVLSYQYGPGPPAFSNDASGWTDTQCRLRSGSTLTPCRSSISHRFNETATVTAQRGVRVVGRLLHVGWPESTWLGRGHFTAVVVGCVCTEGYGLLTRTYFCRMRWSIVRQYLLV